jgi:hypothetical protein
VGVHGQSKRFGRMRSRIAVQRAMRAKLYSELRPKKSRPAQAFEYCVRDTKAGFSAYTSKLLLELAIGVPRSISSGHKKYFVATRAVIPHLIWLPDLYNHSFVN